MAEQWSLDRPGNGNAKLNPWLALPHRWVHLQLPGYRSSRDHATYEGTRLEDLPPIPIELDDDCSWLMTYGIKYQLVGLNEYERNLNPGFVEELARRSGLVLPRSFLRFMTDQELQALVRSCTDCYLDPGERVVETIGSVPGHLIHFLSDSQSCAHWYLHILPGGDSAVLESEDLYCYKIEDSDWCENPACRLERIDLSELDMAYCASSFSEFLYRFWIENEIWYSLTGPFPLTPLQLAYVNHYAKRNQGNPQGPDL